MFKEFLTTEGERLLAKSIAGTANITFTKMMIGDGDRGTSTKAITSLLSPRLTLDIYSVLISGDNNIEITTILDSSAIPEGFYFREKGIYATDGTTEILFMYGTSGSLAEWLENVENTVFTRNIRTIVTLSESDSVNITIQKGAYASGEDAENILEAIQNIKLEGDWATQNQAESILSILDTFVAAYTVLRAGKLDNLDALVSSRAPANTALSNATWTNTRAAAIDTINANAARLTATRAGLIDNLDAKISSRAPASTALSNATWTNARAGYLDYLANSTYGLPAIKAYVDTLESVMGTTTNTGGTASAGTAMAKLNALITTLSSGTAKASCVKKIIRGNAYLSSYEYDTTVTLSETCNPDRCFVLLNGLGYSGLDHRGWATPLYYELTENTIRVYTASSNTPDSIFAEYQIIEFY